VEVQLVVTAGPGAPQHVGRECVKLEMRLNVSFPRPALGIGDFYSLPYSFEKH
jgi:hypothetical protein